MGLLERDCWCVELIWLNKRTFDFQNQWTDCWSIDEHNDTICTTQETKLLT